MPIITKPLTNGEPIIDVLIGLTPSHITALRAQGLPIPSAIMLRALVDSGASQTCIDSQCISTLGLQAAGTRTILTPTVSGTSQTFYAYDVSLTLLHPATNLTIPQLEVVSASLFLHGFEVLLGRDVLNHCLFVYDGPAGTFTLAF